MRTMLSALLTRIQSPVVSQLNETKFLTILLSLICLEMIHYTEGGKRSNLSVNCGVYLFSTQLFNDKHFLAGLQGKAPRHNKADQK